MKNIYTLPTQPEDAVTDVMPSGKTAITDIDLTTAPKPDWAQFWEERTLSLASSAYPPLEQPTPTPTGLETICLSQLSLLQWMLEQKQIRITHGGAAAVNKWVFSVNLMDGTGEHFRSHQDFWEALRAIKNLLTDETEATQIYPRKNFRPTKSPNAQDKAPDVKKMFDYEIAPNTVFLPIRDAHAYHRQAWQTIVSKSSEGLYLSPLLLEDADDYEEEDKQPEFFTWRQLNTSFLMNDTAANGGKWDVTRWRNCAIAEGPR